MHTCVQTSTNQTLAGVHAYMRTCTYIIVTMYSEYSQLLKTVVIVTKYKHSCTCTPYYLAYDDSFA